MKTFILSFFILLWMRINCFYNTSIWNSTLFDFRNYKKIVLWKLQNNIQDFRPNFEIAQINDFIFNFDRSTIIKCTKNSIACIQFKNDSSYYPITSAENWEITNVKSDINFVNSTFANFSFPNISINNHSGTFTFNFLMEFVCDKNVSFKSILISDDKLLNFKLIMMGNEVCQHIVDNFSYFITYLHFMYAVIFILSSLIISGSKLRFIKFKMFLGSFLFFHFLAIYIASFNLDVEKKFYSMLIISLCSGLVGGLFGMFLHRFGISIHAGLAGMIFWWTFYSNFLCSCPSSVLFIGGLAFFLFLFALQCVSVNIIYSISVGINGSYFFIRGISCIFGNYAIESVMYIMKKAEFRVGASYYLYISFFYIIALVLFSESLYELNEGGYNYEARNYFKELFIEN